MRKIYIFAAVIIFLAGHSLGRNKAENACNQKVIGQLREKQNELINIQKQNDKLKKSIVESQKIRSNNHNFSRNELIDSLPTRREIDGD